MENASFIALSRQGVLRRQMDVIANNLANMNTTGFKSEDLMFVEHLVKSRGSARLAPDKLSFVRDIAQIRDLSDGGLRNTGNPFDLAIQNEGFFVIDTDDGERYTRNGRFSIDGEGQLVNFAGFSVQSTAGTAFFFAPDDTDIDIAKDGTVSTNNGILGKIRVVRFENEQEMQKNGGGMLSTDARPEDIDSPQIVQFMLESSNVNPILELTKMIRTQRAYDAATSFISKEDERARRMIDTMNPRF